MVEIRREDLERLRDLLAAYEDAAKELKKAYEDIEEFYDDLAREIIREEIAEDE